MNTFICLNKVKLTNSRLITRNNGNTYFFISKLKRVDFKTVWQLDKRLSAILLVLPLPVENGGLSQPYSLAGIERQPICSSCLCKITIQSRP